MAAITWRNVDAPSSRDAMAGMNQAGATIGGAFDMFSKVIADREVANQKTFDRGENSAKQNFLNMLDQARTPEAMAELQASGAIDQARSGLSAENQAATRAAAEARLTSLRQGVTATQAFDDQRLAVTARPQIDAHAEALARGDFDGAAKIRADYDLPGEGKLAMEQREMVQKFKSETRADEASAHALKMRPYADDAIRRNSETAGLALDAARRTETDRVAVEGAVAPRLQAFEQTKTDFNTKVKEIAATSGFPVDPGTGLPDTDRMSADQLSNFNRALKSRGLDRAPTSSEYLDGMRRDLVAAGASPTAITAAMKQAEPLIKGDTQLSGEDQALMEGMTNSVNVRLEDAKKNNLFYAPPKEANQMKIDVLAKADKLITDGPSTKMRLREDMGNWMEKGIAIRGADGKRVMVPVPPKVIEAAMQAGLESDSWVYNSTSDNMRDNIREIMQSPNYQAQRKEGEYFNTEQHLLDIKNIKRDFKRQTGTVSPSDYLVSFTKKLNEKAAEAIPRTAK